MLHAYVHVSCLPYCDSTKYPDSKQKAHQYDEVRCCRWWRRAEARCRRCRLAPASSNSRCCNEAQQALANTPGGSHPTRLPHTNAQSACNITQKCTDNINKKLKNPAFCSNISLEKRPFKMKIAQMLKAYIVSVESFSSFSNSYRLVQRIGHTSAVIADGALA